MVFERSRENQVKTKQPQQLMLRLFYGKKSKGMYKALGCLILLHLLV